MNEWGPELAVLLGLVEGLTEYLPVSSTGHLILVGHAVGFTGEVASSVEISIQLGAILAVIVYEWDKIKTLAGRAYRDQIGFRHMAAERAHSSWTLLLQESFRLHPSLWFIVGIGLAFLPAALVGVLAHGWIKAHLFTPDTVALSSIAGGLVILAVEAMKDRPRIKELPQVTLSHAWWIGLAQCASLIPGMSRSGSTIVGGLLVGLDRKVATEYSFFLALPTLVAATLYQFLKSHALMSQADLLALGIGLVVSFLTAWAVIALFMGFVKRHTLRAFAYYRMALGALVLYVFAG
ncbi:Undecaprenyl-diphosphatase [Nitrospira tepida]|uniref:Undecaprenyl-diphosphatase n=1 Tax=Nitrospira tepida TaxID=2973512 RepID=A0AA86MXX1_9BACT|nr:undecaprenyl-diphosphate phosphatase [Nitrospira tepida]CAI4030924.1 Undecaprenyl-diphosphatase [Nitrospira tepida]